MSFPNLIIAGPPKAGTTSVFRYLAAHPAVCASSIKEIHFFENYLGNVNEETLEKYQSYFKACKDNCRIRLEASPRYLQGGNPVARAIKQYVPDAKLVFILREPVERFLSRYISLVTKTDRISEEYLSLDKLVDQAISHPQASPNPENPELENEIVEYLWQGCYADFLEGFIEINGAENVSLLFFDELKDEPFEFMKKVCIFSGIDEKFYLDFQFRVENKTRVVKFRTLHKVAEKLNRKLEFVQNKVPALRQLIKSVYYTVLNPEAKNTEMVDTAYAKKRLTEFYKSHNDRLGNLLSEYYSDVSRPDWLNKKN